MIAIPTTAGPNIGLRDRSSSPRLMYGNACWRVIGAKTKPMVANAHLYNTKLSSVPFGMIPRLRNTTTAMEIPRGQRTRQNSRPVWRHQPSVTLEPFVLRAVPCLMTSHLDDATEPTVLSVAPHYNADRSAILLRTTDGKAASFLLHSVRHDRWVTQRAWTVTRIRPTIHSFTTTGDPCPCGRAPEYQEYAQKNKRTCHFVFS